MRRSYYLTYSPTTWVALLESNLNSKPKNRTPKPQAQKHESHALKPMPYPSIPPLQSPPPCPLSPLTPQGLGGLRWLRGLRDLGGTEGAEGAEGG